MPITIVPTSLRYKEGNRFISADCIKGESGDPSYLIDDTAGISVQNRTWSAKKLAEDFSAKADKVRPSTSGNFAGLNVYGNLVDSGHKHSDYAMRYATVLDTTLSRGRRSGTTIGNGSFAFGNNVEASGNYSTAIGTSTSVVQSGSLVTYYVQASGIGSYAQGAGTVASGDYSHAQGKMTTASGDSSHAEGFKTKATDSNSHAGGANSIASGTNSFAQGFYADASGVDSFAQGYYTSASGYYSYAHGANTIANHKSQHVFGECNVEDPSSAAISARGTYVEIVGNGLGLNARSNARTLDWDGNERLKGDIYVNCNDDGSGGTKLDPIVFATDSEIQDIIDDWEVSA